MSNAPHKHAPAGNQPHHHATTTSYIIGFILSLVFTLVPYELVVKKSLHASALLATILVFAVLQMLVQVLFFLHLGREKKPHFNLLFLMSTVSIILLVVVGSLWIMSHLRHNMAGMEVIDKIATDEAVHHINGVQAGTCSGAPGTDYKVMLMDNMAIPSHIDAHLCDTLTIMNHDSSVRTIDFGSPGKAEMYAGETSTSVPPGRNAVLTLTEPGTFAFHERTQSKMSGDFTVTR